MQIPFLFWNKTTGMYWVYMADYDYARYHSGWMGDENLPQTHEILTPDVDIVTEEYSFTNEMDALRKMKELWGKVS